MGGKGSGGQNRKPVEQQRALGNPARRPLPDDSKLVVLPSIVETPAQPLRPLGRYGSQEWERAIEHAAAWLAPSDMGVLQLYCEGIDEYQSWRAQALAEGSNNWRAQLRVDDLRRQLVMLASELGLSTLGRSRLGVAEVRIREGLDRLTAGRVADAAEF